MRVAIVSDIHANLPALDAVARQIAADQVEETWCLGDVVGYGASPREVLGWVEKSVQYFIKGNHDEAVATGDVEGFNPVAAAAARYHAQVLSPDERTRLLDMPERVRRPLGPSQGAKEPHSHEALLVHGSPDDALREYIYPSAAPRDLARWSGLAGIIFLGHTHVPFYAEMGPLAEPAWHAEGFEQRQLVSSDNGGAARLVIVNPGSVGQPRDGDPRASYVLLDTKERTITLQRVPYDIDAAASAIRAARLDPFLAQRLYRGM